MLWNKWYQRRRFVPSTAPASNRAPRKSSRRPIRPRLEELESRLTPAVMNVGAGDVAGLIADIIAANLNGQSNTINLTASTYDLKAPDNFWYGPTGLPAITSDLTIHGNGATIARDSSALPFRLFYVSGGLEQAAGRLTMDNVTLEGGLAKGGDSDLGGGGLGAGGAIFNQGQLILNAVTLTSNEALGGSNGVTTAGDGGGGMGGDAPTSGDGGGFGGSLVGAFSIGGAAGNGGTAGAGGGGGFLATTNGAPGTATAGGAGSGLGGFGGSGGYASTGTSGSGGDGGGGGYGSNSGDGGGFGVGGIRGTAASAGGGGGVGGGGAAGFGTGNAGGGGGFGGGGGAVFSNTPALGGGNGGFGGGGVGNAGDGDGGAIFNMGADSQDGAGLAFLTNCTLTANTAQGGTGTNNNGGGNGAAIYNLDGSVSLKSVTIAGNSVGAVGGQGSIYNEAVNKDIRTGAATNASIVLDNSIVATTVGSKDLVSNVGTTSDTVSVTGIHNLVMGSSGSGIAPGVITITATDPLLGPLSQINGGLTPTMLPQPGSPVLGAGSINQAPSTDQRGVARPSVGPIDLGSVQVSGTLPPPAPSAPPAPPPAPAPKPPPSLFEAIFELYIAEVEKDLLLGNPTVLQNTINFYAQYTVIFGINIAPLIEMLADSAVFPISAAEIQAGGNLDRLV